MNILDCLDRLNAAHESTRETALLLSQIIILFPQAEQELRALVADQDHSDAIRAICMALLGLSINVFKQIEAEAQLRAAQSHADIDND